MDDTPSTTRDHLEAVPRSRTPELAVIDLGAPKPRPGNGLPVVMPAPAPAPDPSAGAERAWFRFSSGTEGLRARQELVRRINTRDFEGARVLLAEREDEFTRFQRNMSCWVLSILEGEAVPTWRRRAELYTVSRVERAAVFENYAFMALWDGNWEGAKQLCHEGIRVCPTVEGLWVNLLAAMDRLGEDDAIDVVLMKLPSLFDLERSFLGRYLANDPGFRAIACNGG